MYNREETKILGEVISFWNESSINDLHFSIRKYFY